MARLHLFEFEDQSWFPSFLRNYMTDFLQFLSNKAKLYGPIIPLLQRVLEESKQNSIVDLGSGGGGGLIWLCEELQKDRPELKITLTDYYPNIKAFEYTKGKNKAFEYIKEPVDARNISKEPSGLRTLFLAFHHFKPKDAKRILENTVLNSNAIGIFEAQERSFQSLFAMFFSPITVLFMTPFIKPFNLGRILFTYLIPIVPVCVWWDGIVSSLRTYSVQEMKELVANVENHESYTWKIDKIKSGPGIILYLTGVPKER